MTTRTKVMQNAALLCLVGAASGWVAGLSTSPVAATVVAALIGIGGAVAVAVSGLRFEGEVAGAKISVQPGRASLPALAAFAVAVAVFAPLGIATRTSNILDLSPAKPTALSHLADDIKTERDAWLNAGLTDKDFLLKSLLYAHIAPTPVVSPTTAAPSIGVLFSASQATCATLAAEMPPERLAELKASADPAIVRFTQLIAKSTEQDAALWFHAFCPA